MTAVVLAGGESRRMGRDKAVLSVGGRELLDRVLEAARGAARRVVVAAGRDVDRRAEDLRRYGWAEEAPVGGAPAFAREDALATVIPDSRPGRGPLAGLEAALLRARPGRAWVLACDLPYVDSAVGAALLARLGRGQSAGGGGRRPRAVVPRVGGRWQPLCAAYETRVGRVAGRCLDGGMDGMHELLALLELDAVGEAELGRSGDPRRLFLNLNRPEDLEMRSDRSGHSPREPRP